MAVAGRGNGALALLGVPVRLYLGGVFVFAGIYKIREPYEFALSVATYQILPLEAVNLFAIVLPWVELVAGALLIAGAWTKENALLILAMMLLFLGALGVALARGYEMNCGCFASREAADEIGMHTLFRDLFWFALGAFVLLFDDGRYGVDRLIGRRARHE